MDHAMPGRRLDRCRDCFPGSAAIRRAQRVTEQGRQLSFPGIGASEKDGCLRSSQIDPVSVNAWVGFNFPDKGAPLLNRRALVEDDNIVGAVPGCTIVKAARQNDLGAAVVSIITMLNIVAVAVGTRRAVIDNCDLAAAEVEDAALTGVAGIAVARIVDLRVLYFGQCGCRYDLCSHKFRQVATQRADLPVYFRPVRAIPCTNLRWKTMKRIRIGSTAITDPARSTDWNSSAIEVNEPEP